MCGLCWVDDGMLDILVESVVYIGRVDRHVENGWPVFGCARWLSCLLAGSCAMKGSSSPSCAYINAFCLVQLLVATVVSMGA